jgi:hypothetical protein
MKKINNFLKFFKNLTPDERFSFLIKEVFFLSIIPIITAGWIAFLFFIIAVFVTNSTFFYMIGSLQGFIIIFFIVVVLIKKTFTISQIEKMSILRGAIYSILIICIILMFSDSHMIDTLEGFWYYSY